MELQVNVKKKIFQKPFASEHIFPELPLLTLRSANT